MGLTRAEQETTLRWAADEKLVSIGDWKKSTFAALTAAGFHPVHTSILDGEIVGWIWQGIPLAAIRITATGHIAARKKRAPIIHTPEQTEALRTRIKLCRKGKAGIVAQGAAAAKPPNP